MDTCSLRRKLTATLFMTTPLLVTAVSAAESTGDELSVKFRGSVTFGSAWRDSDRDPELLNARNAAAIGVIGTASGGRNQDDGNLNFGKGDPISTVLKAYVESTIEYRNLKAHISAKTWHDYTLSSALRPWGNSPNGFRSDIPLSDAGFEARSRFSGITLQSAYLETSTSGAGADWRIRAGNQLIGWGNSWLTAGGLRMADTTDLQALRRPGAQFGEASVPGTALRLTGNWSTGFSADAFWLLSFEKSPSTVCGTFYSVADYLDGGCNKAVLGANATDRENLAAGSFLNLSAVRLPSATGQFGLSGAFESADRQWRVGAYAANLHSRTLFYNIIKSQRTSGPPALANNPGNLNPSYEVEYPDDIHVVSLDGRHQALGGILYGEWVHIPNQPVPLNSGDLVGAFTTLPSVPGVLRADERSTAPGGRYNGWDRLKVSDLRVGFSRELPRWASAKSISLQAEWSGKFVHDLPDVTVRRYRRPDVYGNGPVAGVCTGSAKQCSNDGFATPSAHGVRARLVAVFGSEGGTTFTTGLTVGRDLHGWAYDNSLGQGRRTVGLTLGLSHGKMFGGLAWNRSQGNPYDNTSDRSTLTWHTGLNF